MSVSVQLDGGLTLGTPEVALDSDEFTELFGVSRDGQRFLRHHLPPEALVPELRVVTGWTDRLGREAAGN